MTGHPRILERATPALDLGLPAEKADRQVFRECIQVAGEHERQFAGSLLHKVERFDDDPIAGHCAQGVVRVKEPEWTARRENMRAEHQALVGIARIYRISRQAHQRLVDDRVPAQDGEPFPARRAAIVAAARLPIVSGMPDAAIAREFGQDLIRLVRPVRQPIVIADLLQGD